MSDYKRLYVEGGCYFFTVVTYKRRHILTTKENIRLLRIAFKTAQKKRPFVNDAIVILPNHIHCIWTLPENDDDFSERWKSIKQSFTRQYNAYHKPNKRQPLWQPRFWEHLIRTDRDYEEHMNYIHYNPVKHGYVDAPKLWQHSSFRLMVAKGIYPLDWATNETDMIYVPYEP